MVIKVRDPKRWMMLPMGDVISLGGEQRRPVRLEVNAVTHAAFQLVYPKGEVAFLAAFQGMETIEFIADGPCEVWVTSEAEVYFYTDDGRNTAFVNDGKVSFTKPHERRAGNDAIIYMQSIMLENERRRNAKLEAAKAALEQRQAELENGGGTGEGSVPEGEGGQGVEPAPDPGSGGVAEPEPPKPAT